jgi:hypothetical protein
MSASFFCAGASRDTITRRYIAHGAADEMAKTKSILNTTGTAQVIAHLRARIGFKH